MAEIRLLTILLSLEPRITPKIEISWGRTRGLISTEPVRVMPRRFAPGSHHSHGSVPRSSFALSLFPQRLIYGLCCKGRIRTYMDLSVTA